MMLEASGFKTGSSSSGGGANGYGQKMISYQNMIQRSSHFTGSSPMKITKQMAAVPV
jgi:hypothetical protein